MAEAWSRRILVAKESTMVTKFSLTATVQLVETLGGNGWNTALYVHCTCTCIFTCTCTCTCIYPTNIYIIFKGIESSGFVLQLLMNLVSHKILQQGSKSLLILHTVTAFFSVLNDHSEDTEKAITQVIGSSKEVCTLKFKVRSTTTSMRK